MTHWNTIFGEFDCKENITGNNGNPGYSILICIHIFKGMCMHDYRYISVPLYIHLYHFNQNICVRSFQQMSEVVISGTRYI